MKANKLVVAAVSAVVVAAIVVACGGGGSSGGIEALNMTSGTVIRNATVVDTRTGALKTGMSIAIDSGKILRVSEASGINAGASTQVIDASGKYVVPGFNDMHTHALGTLSTGPSDFPVLLANGITGVREAAGAPALVAIARAQNTAVAAGTANAPEILMLPTAIGLPSSVAGAPAYVTARKTEGADFLKITGGPRDIFLATLAEAKAQNITAAGHLLLSVSALESSNAGYHSYEHLGSGFGLVLDCSIDETAIRSAILANPAPPPANVINPRIFDGNQYAPHYRRIIDTYNDARCTALSQAFVKNDTWQAATMIRLKTQNFGDSAVYRNDPNLQYVDKTRRALWEVTARSYETTVTPAARAVLQEYYGLQLKVVKLMKQNGVAILSGSDLGGGLVIPGFSLHQEFKELAAAGLTPLEVLQTTTLNAAKFVGRETSMGSVEIGKNADLVLLDANPLDSVNNLDRIFAVVNKGRYLSRSALDKILADVAAAYAALPQEQDLTKAYDPYHVD